MDVVGVRVRVPLFSPVRQFVLLWRCAKYTVPIGTALCSTYFLVCGRNEPSFSSVAIGKQSVIMNGLFENQQGQELVAIGTEERCLFFHRTAVIMADGEVVTCANFYAENVGKIDHQSSLRSVWNGSRMQAVRASFRTASEWDQCRSCWFREIKYHSQRSAWANGQTFSLEEGTCYQERSWDFRRFVSADED